MEWYIHARPNHLFMNHLAAMRVSEALREGRARQQEVRKAPHSVGAARLFEGRSDDGMGRKKKKKKKH